jgi:hypothetical protein
MRAGDFCLCAGPGARLRLARNAFRAALRICSASPTADNRSSAVARREENGARDRQIPYGRSATRYRLGHHDGARRWPGLGVGSAARYRSIVLSASSLVW